MSRVRNLDSLSSDLVRPQGATKGEVKVKVKLRFLAPSTGIAEIEQTIDLAFALQIRPHIFLLATHKGSMSIPDDILIKED